MEDKWVGIILAILGTFLIGSSFIITKMGLNAAADRAGYDSASDNLTYLRNPIWWGGMCTMVMGEVMNFAAYAFAPPILVAPLGALSVIIGAILASVVLKEELGHIGRVGITLCLIGSIIIVLHAPEDRDIQTVDEILHFALQPGFLMYCLVALIFSLAMIYVVAPRYGKSYPLVYISICSVVGSVSIMGVKGFGVALKLTLAGNNQLTHPSTYVFGIVVVVCILVQMNYFNKALDTFSTNVVNPIYFVCFTTATITASLILFQGFDTTGYLNTLSLLAGFIVTFLGVHLLEIARSPSVPPSPDPRDHGLFENSLMNPRINMNGRRSDSDWDGLPPHSAGSGHARRSSVYRSNGGSGNWAIPGLEAGLGPQDVPLGDLREEEEGDDDDDDERAQLTGKERDRRRRRSEGAEGGRHPALDADPHSSGGRSVSGRVP